MIFAIIRGHEIGSLILRNEHRFFHFGNLETKKKHDLTNFEKSMLEGAYLNAPSVLISLTTIREEQ